MNYELALKLKKAGYPQPGLMYTWYYDNRGIHNTGCEYLKVDYHPERIVCPTLEELIEACGKVVLSNLEGEWEAGTDMSGWDDGSAWVSMKSPEQEVCKGKTPEEAVANLWLELKKKKS